VAKANGGEPGADAAGTPAVDEKDFQPLFDGKSLKNWDGNPKFWSVVDGAIVGRTTKDNPTSGNTFLIWRGGTVEDFELRLSYRIAGGNSGIQYRSKDYGNWVVGGYQADIEDGKTFTGILYEERGSRGIMARRGEIIVFDPDGTRRNAGSLGRDEEILSAIKPKDWNDYTIVAKGTHLVHTINGKTTVSVSDNDAKRSVRSGILALQLHAGPPMTIEFKNVRLRVIKP
jgi:hypothetical protein